MTKRKASPYKPGPRDLIEQAIARQWTAERIMRELDVTYEEYCAVSNRLDRVARST